MKKPLKVIAIGLLAAITSGSYAAVNSKDMLVMNPKAYVSTGQTVTIEMIPSGSLSPEQMALLVKQGYLETVPSKYASRGDSATKIIKPIWKGQVFGQKEEFSGIASFYGNDHGNETSSGERFNENDYTAAHRDLPFGTMLRVTFENKSIIVKVNDRGPFVKGRVLDLSKAAAYAIGITDDVGIGHVKIEVL